MSATAHERGAIRVGTLAAVLRAVGVAVIVWALASVGAEQVRKAFALQDGLSDVADPYSEANALRAGESYADRGFAHAAGLPDVGYGTSYGNVGMKFDRGWCQPVGPCVYTHYPPGPDWLVGVATVVWGKGHASLYRLFPIGIGLVGMAFLAWALTRSLGAFGAAVVVVVLCRAPMVANMMHALHYQGNGLHVLLAQLAVALLVFGGRARATPALVACAALGFVQGFLSFDYTFLAILFAAPLWLLVRPTPTARDALRTLLPVVVASGAGFAVAVGLHFLQDAAYFGSMRAMLDHMRETARLRSSGEMWFTIDFRPLVAVWLNYYGVLVESPRFFDANLVADAAAVAGACLVGPSPSVPIPGVGLVRWGGRRRDALAILVAFAVSSLWISVMRSHALNSSHHAFLPRHFFLFYFTTAFAAVRGVEVSSSSEPASEPRGRGAGEASTDPVPRTPAEPGGDGDACRRPEGSC